MRTLWTPEQKQLLRDNYHKVSKEQLVNLIGRDIRAIRIQASKMCIAKPGNPSKRKGMATASREPDGSKKIWKSNYGSFWHIKVNGKWLRLHRYLWEQQYGEIPKTSRLKCIDGDTLNYNTDNWKLMAGREYQLEVQKGMNLKQRAIHSGLTRRTRPKMVNQIINVKVNPKTVVQVPAHKLNSHEKRQKLLERYKA